MALALGSHLVSGERPVSELIVRSQLDVFKEQSPALVQEPLPAHRRSLE